MEWLTADKAKQSGIDFATVEDHPSSFDPAKTMATPKPFDPIGTVTAFYNALSAADGESAGAFVIPEKRGIGPFNEGSIHSFYGNLLVSLRLMSVSMITSTLVEARYTYTQSNHETCDGLSEIETTYQFGKTLIEKINARNGC
jgi:hypothetical protein